MDDEIDAMAGPYGFNVTGCGSTTRANTARLEALNAADANHARLADAMFSRALVAGGNRGVGPSTERQREMAGGGEEDSDVIMSGGDSSDSLCGESESEEEEGIDGVPMADPLLLYPLTAASTTGSVRKDQMEVEKNGDEEEDGGVDGTPLDPSLVQSPSSLRSRTPSVAREEGSSGTSENLSRTEPLTAAGRVVTKKERKSDLSSVKVGIAPEQKSRKLVEVLARGEVLMREAEDAVAAAKASAAKVTAGKPTAGTGETSTQEKAVGLAADGRITASAPATNARSKGLPYTAAAGKGGQSEGSSVTSGGGGNDRDGEGRRKVEEGRKLAKALAKERGREMGKQKERERQVKEKAREESLREFKKEQAIRAAIQLEKECSGEVKMRLEREEQRLEREGELKPKKWASSIREARAKEMAVKPFERKSSSMSRSGRHRSLENESARLGSRKSSSTSNANSSASSSSHDSQSRSLNRSQNSRSQSRSVTRSHTRSHSSSRRRRSHSYMQTLSFSRRRRFVRELSCSKSRSRRRSLDGTLDVRDGRGQRSKRHSKSVSPVGRGDGATMTKYGGSKGEKLHESSIWSAWRSVSPESSGGDRAAVDAAERTGRSHRSMCNTRGSSRDGFRAFEGRLESHSDRRRGSSRDNDRYNSGDRSSSKMLDRGRSVDLVVSGRSRTAGISGRRRRVNSRESERERIGSRVLRQGRGGSADAQSRPGSESRERRRSRSGERRSLRSRGNGRRGVSRSRSRDSARERSFKAWSRSYERTSFRARIRDDEDREGSRRDRPTSSRSEERTARSLQQRRGRDDSRSLRSRERPSIEELPHKEPWGKSLSGGLPTSANSTSKKTPKYSEATRAAAGGAAPISKGVKTSLAPSPEPGKNSALGAKKEVHAVGVATTTSPGREGGSSNPSAAPSIVNNKNLEPSAQRKGNGGGAITIEASGTLASGKNNKTATNEKETTMGVPNVPRKSASLVANDKSIGKVTATDGKARTMGVPRTPSKNVRLAANDKGKGKGKESANSNGQASAVATTKTAVAAVKKRTGGVPKNASAVGVTTRAPTQGTRSNNPSTGAVNNGGSSVVSCKGKTKAPALAIKKITTVALGTDPTDGVKKKASTGSVSTASPTLDGGSSEPPAVAIDRGTTMSVDDIKGKGGASAATANLTATAVSKDKSQTYGGGGDAHGSSVTVGGSRVLPATGEQVPVRSKVEVEVLTSPGGETASDFEEETEEGEIPADVAAALTAAVSRKVGKQGKKRRIRAGRSNWARKLNVKRKKERILQKQSQAPAQPFV